MKTFFMLLIISTSGPTAIGPYSSIETCLPEAEGINLILGSAGMSAVCVKVQ